jgi:hypothetical protein
MPAFHKNPPEASIACAVSRSGFSRKLFSGTATGPVHIAVQFQIAIPRLGAVGRDAERHERACSSRFCPFCDRRAERIGVGDHMVRRRHQHQCIWRVLQHQRRGQDGRRRVTAHRLDDYARIGESPDLGRLFEREKPERVACHHKGRAETLGGEPAKRHLIQALAAPEGARTAWDRPCATPATSACRSRRTG